MSHLLPETWALASLPDLISRDGILIDGDWVESKDQDPLGQVRLIQLADIGDGFYLNRSDRYLTPEKVKELRGTLLRPGDVLIARMPEPLGRACIFPGDVKNCVTVVDVCIVRTGTLGPDHKWLVHTVNAPQFRGHVQGLQKGTTRKRISRRNLGTISIPIPPLDEQHRIVAEIEKQFTRLDAAVAALKRVRANLKRYRAAVLKAASEGRLVPTEAELARAEGRDYEPADKLLVRVLDERRAHWEADQLAKMRANGKPPIDDKWKTNYKEPSPPDISDLPALPEGWKWISLDFLLTGIEAGKSFKCEERPPKSDEMGVVKVSAVTWGTFQELESKTCTREARANPAYLIQEGDFLFSRANTIDLVGACVIVYSVSSRVMLSDKILRFRFVGIPNQWVLHVLRSRFGRDEIERLATGNQESMRNIGQDRIRQIRIPLPPEGELARSIERVERDLSMIEELSVTVKEDLKRAERLRQSILKQAFEGNLVPQDPSDEAASALLKRIRAEREQPVQQGLPHVPARRLNRRGV